MLNRGERVAAKFSEEGEGSRAGDAFRVEGFAGEAVLFAAVIGGGGESSDNPGGVGLEAFEFDEAADLNDIEEAVLSVGGAEREHAELGGGSHAPDRGAELKVGSTLFELGFGVISSSGQDGLKCSEVAGSGLDKFPELGVCFADGGDALFGYTAIGRCFEEVADATGARHVSGRDEGVVPAGESADSPGERLVDSEFPTDVDGAHALESDTEEQVADGGLVLAEDVGGNGGKRRVGW